jgi:hypothetical protein
MLKRTTAWNGFYKNVKEIEELNTQEKDHGWSGSLAKNREMAKMRAKKYAKSLVFEHDWQDVHTQQYFVKGATQ